MRLLNVDDHTLLMQEFNDRDVPPYAVFSHTWEDEEVLFSDLPMHSSKAASKHGHAKILALCDMVIAHNLKYVWVDTCCIDKSSTTELGEAINAMYQWYSRAAVCIAYLADYKNGSGNIADAKWFKRGWTLQELIAPRHVHFYDNCWTFIGTKAQLGEELSQVTGIEIEVLHGKSPKLYSIAQRMAWAAGRETTRVEDRAYSLLGLFDVNMPMIYGITSSRNAFVILQEEIIKHSDDQTIFAWSETLPRAGYEYCGLLATSPDAFKGCSDIVRSPSSGLNSSGWGITNVGLTLSLYVKPCATHTYTAVLDCTSRAYSNKRYAIFLEGLQDENQYGRVRVGVTAIMLVDSDDKDRREKVICVRQKAGPSVTQPFGFWIRNFDFTGRSGTNLLRQIDVSSERRTVDHPDQGILIESNAFQVGTTASIRLPFRKRYPDSKGLVNPFQLREVKLGFGQDFLPACLLSLGDTIMLPTLKCSKTRNHEAHQRNIIPTRPSSIMRSSEIRNWYRERGALSGDNWLDERYNFIGQGLYRLKAGSTQLSDSYTSIRVSISPLKCPLPLAQEGRDLDAQCVIWIVDIVEIDKRHEPTHIEAVTFGIIDPCRSLRLELRHGVGNAVTNYRTMLQDFKRATANKTTQNLSMSRRKILSGRVLEGLQSEKDELETGNKNS